MADSNYNMIKPVESLQTIAGLTPVTKREEKNRQKNQKQQKHNEKDAEKTTENAFEIEPENKVQNLQGDSNSIDFCA